MIPAFDSLPAVSSDVAASKRNSTESGKSETKEPFQRVFAKQSNSSSAKEAPSGEAKKLSSDEQSGGKLEQQSGKTLPEHSKTKRGTSNPSDNLVEQPSDDGSGTGIGVSVLSAEVQIDTSSEMSNGALHRPSIHGQIPVGQATVVAGRQAAIQLQNSTLQNSQVDQVKTGMVSSSEALQTESSLASGKFQLELESVLPEHQMEKLVERFSAADNRAVGTPTSSAPASVGASGSILNSSPVEQAGVSKPTLIELATPVTDPKWGGDFAAQVKLLVTKSSQQATLQLSPGELGQLEIKISTDGDQAKIQFMVSNSAAREAIEMAMPKLREMLEQGGLQLSQSNVFDQSQGNPNANEAMDGLMASSTDLDAEEKVVEQAIRLTDSGSSSVDYYI